VQVYRSTVIDASADEVWARIRDFGSLAEWWVVEGRTCEVLDGKAGDQVSAVRRIGRADGTSGEERMVAHSDAERSYTYEIDQPSFPATGYRATVRVSPVTDGDRAFFEWWGSCDCDASDRAAVETRLAGTYESGGADLKAFFSR
jgi:hypothetical protein